MESFEKNRKLKTELILKSNLDPVYNGSIRIHTYMSAGRPSIYTRTAESAIRISLGSLSKVYQFGYVSVEVYCKRLARIRTGTDRIRDNKISRLEADLI